jgi:hypothetical protein
VNHAVLVETDGLLRLKLTENLRQMPRMVEIALGCNSGGIEVAWMDSTSDLAAVTGNTHIDLCLSNIWFS